MIGRGIGELRRRWALQLQANLQWASGHAQLVIWCRVMVLILKQMVVAVSSYMLT